jgi:RimJ/RimL family protein N-acetyltransferase
MNNIAIVDFQKSDLHLMVKWRSDNHINHFLRPGLRTLPELQDWYDQYFSLQENKLFCIKIDDSPVGYFTIEHIDLKNKNCEFGIVVGVENLHRKGIGTSVLNLMLERAFSHMGMHRIYAYIQAGNIASEKCFLKSGFVQEGKQRESRFIDNKFRDILVYSILKHEWNI